MHRLGRVDGDLRLYLQGCFAFTCDGAAIEMPHSSERVVALLTLRGGGSARDAVAATLWSNATGDRAAAALRTALWRLESSPARGLICARGRELTLRDDVHIDFWATARRARSVIAGLSGEAGLRDIALLRDSADLLADWYEDWAIVEREQFRELRLEALERICRDLSRAGRYADAVQAGLAAVAGEPHRESAHHALIAAHLSEGNRADALRQYELMSALLRRNLDLEPSPAVRELLGARAR